MNPCVSRQTVRCVCGQDVRGHDKVPLPEDRGDENRLFVFVYNALMYVCVIMDELN